MNIRLVLSATCAAVALAISMPATSHGIGVSVTPNFAHAIPNIPGKSLIFVVVNYAPGGASAPHMHARFSFIYAYVISGAIELQVNDGPKRIYHAGETFFEMPDSVHRVSRNASKIRPAKLLAVIVVDTADKTHLTTPMK